MVTFCPLQKGMVVGGHYQITKFLGRGSMGMVYQAKDSYFTDYNRIVACKIFPKELRQTPGLEQYFKREFLAAQELVHQNICCTYEFGEDNNLDTYYLIMEYVNGKTLRTLIREKESYNLAEALPLIEQIAQALDFAHNKGIVHLDMKPDNVMVTDTGNAKIMDFGLARVINSNMTHISLLEMEGTPLYMSPEQINPDIPRKRITYSTDRWALGVIVYEMLAGYPPFDGRMGVTPLIQSILKAQPEPLPLPNNTWKAIDKMLSKDPKERFASCMEFYRALIPAPDVSTYIPIESPKESSPLKNQHSTKKSLFPRSTISALGEPPEEFELDSKLEEEKPRLKGSGVDTSKLRLSVISSLGDMAEESGESIFYGIEMEDEEEKEAPSKQEDCKSNIESEKLKLSEEETSTSPSQVTVVVESGPREEEFSLLHGRSSQTVWQKVSQCYPNPTEIEKAHSLAEFEFIAINPQRYLVYRHKNTGMKFILVPSGTFWMGSPDGQGHENEHPGHEVYLDAYLISITVITQGVWEQVMGYNPSAFQKGSNYPVEKISWYDLQKFCQKTSLSIPTEAQWERACRAGTTTVYYWGNEMDGSYCCYGENSHGSPQIVKSKKPNNFGLYDMCGNVWEWCRDDYYERAYIYHERCNPVYLKDTGKKVRRGGSWLNSPDGCRCAVRQGDPPSRRTSGLGGRVAYSV